MSPCERILTDCGIKAETLARASRRCGADTGLAWPIREQNTMETVAIRCNPGNGWVCKVAP